MADPKPIAPVGGSSLQNSDIREIQWDDPHEKRNPHNWPIWKKLFHTAVPCVLAFVMQVLHTFGTSVNEAALDLIATRFNVSQTVSMLTLTLYTLGLAFGPLVIAPLSETFGRRPVYIFTSTCLLTFSAGAGAANNLATLLVCRGLAGALGSSGIAIGAGTLADIWDLDKEGGPASLLFVLGPFLGPTTGPLAGAYVLKDHGDDWRWTQWVMVILCAPVWLGAVLMQETMKERILVKTKSDDTHLEKGGGSQQQPELPKPSLRDLITTGLGRPVKLLCTEVIVFSLTLYTAFAYAMIFSYFASSSYVYTIYYGFDWRQVGLTFISVIVGYVLAALMFGIFDKTLYVRARVAGGGVAAPEHRLYSAMAGSVLLPVGLFWYAWEAHAGGHWAALVCAGIPFGVGAFSLFLSAITYLVDVYQAGAAASALAANGVIRYCLGATFPLFTVQMYEKLGVHWASSLYAFLSLFLLPIPWVLFKYGASLRGKGYSR
ncbi:putative MFS polyamine transporter [Aspergillus saccharolyticus JOP 1030-1]|uniref:Putative MFS polyamine transporter n=1 Tax=Aspergillus saccharolyticus JOP 1030-1 TaxID=1450539 RepID=A0A318ZHA8_9EURO|nr:putative MFS polyamine transporter [Aspergillus saccharolyticus JOP 1030-1]PYH46961.1 putative MFS polyamine transporter [Aspergillus saccharolyticus JOP 1030-1]